MKYSALYLINLKRMEVIEVSHIVRIISERERKRHVEYRREFQLIGDYPGNGYSFPCKADGTFIKDENYDCWIENYEYCLAHPEKYEDMGVNELSWNYTEPALAKCSCGREIYLEGDQMCDCGQWYNLFGQALRDPEYWYDEGYGYQFSDQTKLVFDGR